MKRFDLWKMSLLNIFAAPMRSALTVLGMAIGIGAVLAVMTLGDAGRMQVHSEMNRLGIDKVWLSASGSETLQMGDGELLSKALSVRASEAVYLTLELGAGDRRVTSAAVGCGQPYLEMCGVALCQGRMLYPLEWKADSRSLLLGEKTASNLQVQAGDMVLLNGLPFWVRGIIRGADSFTQVDASSAVFIPMEALAAMVGKSIHEIMMDVPEGMSPQTAAAMAQRMMESRRGINVDTLTLQVQMEAAESVIEIFVDVLKWVAIICILVGGIGVMNILLVSVRERRREIGIMKSLGTTHRQICTLFLLEALSYATIGGVLGILLGQMLIIIAGSSIGLQAQVQVADGICVLMAALMIGLVFGVVPASKAAALKCVDALQEE